MENIEALVGKESRTKISNVNLNHAALSHDTSNNLSEFKCPTLIMAGRLDPICSMLGTDEMSKLAETCRQYGVEDLFLSSMKIYGRVLSAISTKTAK